MGGMTIRPAVHRLIHHRGIRKPQVSQIRTQVSGACAEDPL